MSGSQVFVGIFAIGSAVVSVAAIWRVAKTSGVSYKPLWMVGSLFGFLGFATNLSFPGDLHLQFGLQIPVVMIFMPPAGGAMLQAMFPFVAVAALVKCHSPGNAPGE
jgi:hypothetical protein